MLKHKKVAKSQAINEFCVSFRDSISETTINKAAEKNGIKLYHKGHSKTRLYAICSDSQWDIFLEVIHDLSVVENCRIPNWLNRAIQKKLVQSTRCKLNLACAKKSEQLLMKLVPMPELVKDDNASEPPIPVDLNTADPSSIAHLEKTRSQLHRGTNAVLRLCVDTAENIKKWLRLKNHVYSN